MSDAFQVGLIIALGVAYHIEAAVLHRPGWMAWHGAGIAFHIGAMAWRWGEEQ